MTGKIKTISKKRGFGFIRLHDGEDVFFHRSMLSKGLNFFNLRQGDLVEFDIVNGDKGLKAENIVFTTFDVGESQVSLGAIEKLKRFFSKD